MSEINKMGTVNEYGIGLGTPPQNAMAGIWNNIFPKNETTEKPPTMEDITDKEQKELWAREDAIRKEIQEREDNINQRMVADMRKAGINPNLIGGASAVGGGITNASKKDLTRIENEKERAHQLLVLELEHAFKGSEADKDRVLKLLDTLVK